ncbi:UDP-N-acetylmuramate dehydrogenase [Bailinhaonella thermotolerans]|uniref:UDP-N-acetylenolpyruvoylglucosamine reductase n=1 Tax=Bailinhaonella thermotolerans TaxID=1070861 RepID=A0A3A4B4V9_9ACTN|nr:UDP-N-acetylmuramate dehydrogenase [Bailinhaonella thermotolerans]RJL33101.1 UDP-N-acetylmuramate dehydrogenase [Bailinhaonella thermotolerans]
MAVLSDRVRLAPYTTMRVGGPARRFVEVTTPDEVVRAVGEADDAGESVLILGGGSNLVISDTGFPGTVIHVSTRGITSQERDGAVLVTAQAGEDWDAFVARCVSEGLAGVECLSGIPGRVGATPIQNVGAYGQEVSQTIESVEVVDRRAREVLRMTAEECRFTYRDSVFKGSDRYTVLSVTYALTPGAASQPIAYAELAGHLGVELGDRVPLAAAREAVLAVRRRKGMVLDPADPDTRSAGSFFTNPVLSAAEAADLELRAPGHPRWELPGGQIKVPAAWLIEQSGFPKGYERGKARISTKHTLALTNPTGEATADDILALAREVRDGVAKKFGVTLVNEPIMIGASL